MGKQNKKKTGKGAEKTEKKLTQKMKKELKLKGEDDIEAIVAKLALEDKKKMTITETLKVPSKRSSFSLTAHPDKDQMIMFGGEYYNGSKTLLYNELYFYEIKKDKWLQVSSPGAPPPRCSHQAVAVSQCGGQLWVFGGEFTSQSQNQFHHYKDLWVFHFESKKWEKIEPKGTGPSARSGHRMVHVKKHLVVFGGFRDNSRNYNYFNDVYAFDMQEYTWTKLDVKGNGPSERSACQMMPLSDGRILVYGGYSRMPSKNEADLGTTHSDMFILAPDKHDTTGSKFKWQVVKQSGCKPPPRSSLAMTLCPGDKALMFGGIYDEIEDEEELQGECLNDLHQLDLTNGCWKNLEIVPKKDPSKQPKKTDQQEDVIEDPVEDEVTMDDGVFTVTIGASKKVKSPLDVNADDEEVFLPPPRLSAGLAFKRGLLYVYGGIFEDGDKQLTLDDFYSLDVSKLEEWQTIKALEPADLEWFDSDTEDEEETDDDESDEGSSS